MLSQFVDPRPRFTETDQWDSTTTWSKDYQWRGYTVFVLKSSQGDQVEQGERPYDDPTIAAPRRATSRVLGENWSEGEESLGVEQQEASSFGDHRSFRNDGEGNSGIGHQEASSSSGYRSHRNVGEGAVINVTVNVNNNVGNPNSNAQNPSSPPEVSCGESDSFEFVTP